MVLTVLLLVHFLLFFIDIDDNIRKGRENEVSNCGWNGWLECLRVFFLWETLNSYWNKRWYKKGMKRTEISSWLELINEIHFYIFYWSYFSFWWIMGQRVWNMRIWVIVSNESNYFISRFANICYLHCVVDGQIDKTHSMAIGNIINLIN